MRLPRRFRYLPTIGRTVSVIIVFAWEVGLWEVIGHSSGTDADRNAVENVSQKREEVKTRLTILHLGPMADPAFSFLTKVLRLVLEIQQDLSYPGLYVLPPSVLGTIGLLLKMKRPLRGTATSAL